MQSPTEPPVAPPSETHKDQPVLTFASPALFAAWLAAHHASHPGFWLKIAKKASGIASVTYAEALDEALCWGWIDSQKASWDETAFLQRFTPRKPRSPWSKVNVGHVARLTAEGRIQPPGQAAIAAAQADGRWEQAYDAQSAATEPDDFLTALAAAPAAQAFWPTLNKANRYAFIWRIQTAKKPETRAKRIAWAIELLSRGEKLH